MADTSSTLSFKPVQLKEYQEIGGQEKEGHELFRLLVLLMAEQIREKYYASRDELTWAQVAQHLNENFQLTVSDCPDLVRRNRGGSTMVISDDVLYEIDKGKIRQRRLELLELVGLATQSPLNGKPFTVYEMLAIIRADKEYYPEFDLLRNELSDTFDPDPFNGVQEFARVVFATLELLDWSNEQLADHLNEFLGVDNYFSTELIDTLEEQIENPSEDWKPPMDFVTTLQATRLVRSPLTGKPYTGNELIRTLNGKFDPSTGKPPV